jgi:mono/diheme cytochrome c family protein
MAQMIMRRERSAGSWAIALGVGLVLACAARAEDWQGKAVELYPQLGVAGSDFSKEFGRMRLQKKSTDPAFFANPKWPVLLAQECGNKLGIAAKPQAAPVATAKESPEMEAGRKLYEKKCGRCHDAFGPGVEEMTWNRWIWKWKDKARLTDEEYDQLMDYARRFREARQAKMAK